MTLPQDADPDPTPDPVGSATPDRAAGVWRLLGILAGVYLIVFGSFVLSVGQADDSPGLGGLGLVTAIIGLVLGMRSGQRPRPRRD